RRRSSHHCSSESRRWLSPCARGCWCRTRARRAARCAPRCWRLSAPAVSSCPCRSAKCTCAASNERPSAPTPAPRPRSGSRSSSAPGGDEVTDPRLLAGEAVDALFDRLVGARDALVLAQVVEPGVDEVGLDEPARLCRILVHAP